MDQEKELDTELIREWITAARQLQATMERFPMRRATDHLPPLPPLSSRTGDVSIKVEDGKAHRLMLLAVFSAVLCATLSIIQIVALVGGGMLYLNMKDHLDAIYMMAPQLKTGDVHP